MCCSDRLNSPPISDANEFSPEFAADPPDWNLFRSSPVKGSEKPERVKDMKRTVLALTTAVTIGMTALTATSPAEARWRGGGWGPGLAAGLVGAAVIGGIASSAYAYGPGYGYYGGYPSLRILWRLRACLLRLRARLLLRRVRFKALRLWWLWLQVPRR